MVERGWSDEYLAVGMQLMEQTSTGTRAVQTLICQHRLPRIRDLRMISQVTVGVDGTTIRETGWVSGCV